MKNNKAKEQLLGILTLASVFIFIIYLKMNPEISSDSFSQKQEINSMINDSVNEIIITNNETLVSENTYTEEPDISDNTSMITFTEKELNRAKKYQDRNWKADNTINIAAWEYILNNPNLNQVDDIDTNIEVVNATK